MSQPPAQPETKSGWSKTRSGFSTVGKGANSARSGINSGLSKLDNMTVSKKGLSFEKKMSGMNVSYDRDNHVSRPKMDVSHLPPPPKRTPGQAIPPTTSQKSVASTTRPLPPSPAARVTPSISPAPRPGSTGRPVPPPPPPKAKPNSSQESLPAYTPTTDNITSQFNRMKVAPATTAPKPGAAQSSIPSMNEASTAFSSAKTVGSLYGKYGNQQPGQKTATPSWAEVKAGASAAQNLHSFHGKYAPKQAQPSTQSVQSIPPPAQTMPQAIVAPQPTKPASLRAPIPTPSPKPPLPRGKPTLGPPKEYCIGLFSFEAQAPGDLSFEVGDKIEVIERTNDPDAWWRGKLNGRDGIFPGNYCRLESS